MFRSTLLISASVAALAFGGNPAVSAQDVQTVKHHLDFATEILEYHMMEASSGGGRRLADDDWLKNLENGVKTVTADANKGASALIASGKAATQAALAQAGSNVKKAVSAKMPQVKKSVFADIDDLETTKGQEALVATAEKDVAAVKKAYEASMAKLKKEEEKLKCMKNSITGVRALTTADQLQVAGSCALVFLPAPLNFGGKTADNNCVTTLSSVLNVPETCAQSVFNIMQCALATCVDDCSDVLVAVVTTQSIKSKDDIKVAAKCGVCTLPCVTKFF